MVGRKGGGADEELATDKHGRVMVKFHWDRRGDTNGPEDDSSDKDKEQFKLRADSAFVIRSPNSRCSSGLGN